MSSPADVPYKDPDFNDDYLLEATRSPSEARPRESLEKLNIWDGNVHYNLTQHLSAQGISSLRAISGLPDIAPPKGDFDSNVRFVRKLLETETSFSLEKFNIFPRFASTRDTIDTVLAKVAGPSGKVALPVPNWNFWNTDGHKEGKFAFQYMSVSNADELVAAFEKTAPNVKALLLVNPPNPLGYNLSNEHCSQIDNIAQRHGVKVVIDDVLRGNQPISNRESLGVQFSEPLVIEGFSHRFGRNMRHFSYVLVPKTQKSVLEPSNIQVPTSLLQEVYDKCNEAIGLEMTRRNRAMTEGFFDLDVRMERTSDTQITTMLYLPKNVNLKRIHPLANEQNLIAGTIYAMLPPSVEPPLKYKHAMRVSVGTMSAPQAYDAAYRLSKVIKQAS